MRVSAWNRTSGLSSLATLTRSLSFLPPQSRLLSNNSVVKLAAGNYVEKKKSAFGSNQLAFHGVCGADHVRRSSACLRRGPSLWILVCRATCASDINVQHPVKHFFFFSS